MRRCRNGIFEAALRGRRRSTYDSARFSAAAAPKRRHQCVDLYLRYQGLEQVPDRSVRPRSYFFFVWAWPSDARLESRVLLFALYITCNPGNR